MNKGYLASDILEQLSKLDEVGIHYNVFYINGLGGKDTGVESATSTAEVLNKLHPCIINIVSLTVFPEPQLYQEVLDGSYEEEPEIERLIEMRTLIDRLKIKVNLMGHHISNTVPITGALPDDKVAILRKIDKLEAIRSSTHIDKRISRIMYLQNRVQRTILCGGTYSQRVPTETGQMAYQEEISNSRNIRQAV